MDRFFIPRLGVALVVGLATVLIWVIVLRSPDTHAHLWGEARPSYTRTAIAWLSGEVPREVPRPRVALGQPGVRWEAGQPLEPGRRIYLEAGCATCHGVDARGGPVGPSLAHSFPSITKRMVREGPGGMPTYGEAVLSEAELDKMAAYLQGLAMAKPSSEEVAAIQNLTWDPAVPVGTVLKGKAALRRSCGACHTQPTREEILHAFGSDAEAAGLVAQMVYETNLSLEDARAITYYMLAILNGADPVKER